MKKLILIAGSSVFGGLLALALQQTAAAQTLPVIKTQVKASLLCKWSDPHPPRGCTDPD